MCHATNDCLYFEGLSLNTKNDFIVDHKPGGGRKRITNCRNERTINRIVRKNRFSTLIAYRKSLSELNVNISLTTLQRRMKDLEYVIRVPKRKGSMGQRTCF